MAESKKRRRSRYAHLARVSQHEIDERAKRVFTNSIPPQWVTRETGGNDYGIDYQIEVFENHQPRALRSAVQLKGTTQIQVVEDEIRFSLETRALATYVDTEVLPVFLVVANVEQGVAYFAFLQGYARERLKDGWRDQETITIALRCEDRVADTPRFRAALGAAHRHMAYLRPASIEGALRAEEARLRAIDPRFLVEVAADARGRLMTLAPLQPVRMKLGVTRDVDPEKMRNFVTGQRVAFEAGEFRFEGMPLWQHLNHQESQVQVGVEHACAASFDFRGREGAFAQLLNVPTTLVRGLEGFSMTSALVQELFTFTMSALPEGSDEGVDARASLSLSLSAWLGFDVRLLPHFESIRALSVPLQDPMSIDLIVHFPGANFAWPRFEIPTRQGATEFAAGIDSLRKARAITTQLDRPLRFLRLLDDEDVETVDKIFALLTTGEYRGPGDRARVTYTANKKRIDRRLLEAKGGDLEIRMKSGRDTDQIFGSKFEYPVGTVLLTAAQAPRLIPTQKKNEVLIEILGSSVSEFVLRSSHEPF